MNTTCKNCGGDKGLHHWQTMQCPFGGREAPIGQPDQWTSSTFEPETDELESLRADNAKLRKALEAITERAEAVSEGIVVEKRNPGVSQAKHVSHMANHLAQHAKIARRVLEETSHA